MGWVGIKRDRKTRGKIRVALAEEQKFIVVIIDQLARSVDLGESDRGSVAHSKCYTVNIKRCQRSPSGRSGVNNGVRLTEFAVLKAQCL